ncbi:hypothetical protein CLV90_1073 [Maribacter spongiicola]|uniref:Phage abortive infection protein n=1 Tax=Maribacter spongiicola TaxID=1206753 RepID=A0A4R7K6U9_9FLAO|nr:hypothetical protein [Maribacter spongiicola]TDT47006.1 hypothetical protein CLV90_1073 [Maribacter spongiicola]
MQNTETQSNDSTNKPLVHFMLWEWTIIVVLLILIIFGPIIFTQLSWGPDFKATGGIGDTIGGITAPFVNLLAAFLVYKSFTAQIEANRRQRDDHNAQMKQLITEHSYNYISNLFVLAKDYYYSNNVDAGNNKKFVINLYEIASKARQRIKEDYEHSSEHHLILKDQHKNLINKSNGNAINQLLKIKSNLDNMYDFLIELERTKLESGIRKFYFREIQRMLVDMNIWRITDKEYLKDLKKYDIITNQGSIDLIEDCSNIVDKMYDLGIKIEKVSKYLVETE